LQEEGEGKTERFECEKTDFFNGRFGVSLWGWSWKEGESLWRVKEVFDKN